MKAVIISDDNTAIERFSIVLKAAGYDTIVYRWFIKAFDNIEEIAPHLILISTLDYPRHWKMLAQYTKSDAVHTSSQIILYTGGNFSVEDQKKALELGIRGIFSSYDVDGLDKLRAILEHPDDIFSGTLNDSADFTEAVLPCVLPVEKAEIWKDKCLSLKYLFMFTNPNTGTFVTGRVTSYVNSKMEFIPDYLAEGSLPTHTIIPQATLIAKNCVKYVCAIVEKNGKELELLLK